MLFQQYKIIVSRYSFLTKSTLCIYHLWVPDLKNDSPWIIWIFRKLFV